MYAVYINIYTVCIYIYIYIYGVSVSKRYVSYWCLHMVTLDSISHCEVLTKTNSECKFEICA